MATEALRGNGEAPAVEAAEATSAEKVPFVSRRNLFVGLGGTAVLLALGTFKLAGAAPGVRPPGGQDEAHVISACIHCEKCVEVCPHRIIRPAHIEEGILGMRTPILDFSHGWCDWCEKENDGVPLCAEVCPTRALRLPEGATPETLILGKAELNIHECLAYRLIGCRFCYDACIEARGPEKAAITLDDLSRPVVHGDLCNGCGACEAVCVSLENGSIGKGATKRAIVVRAE
ncbi:MAG: 4Fe-4S dicluster domain-containing protein [Eggerthellaceae bacterium]|nr:4Fe-4S dicluster domain-containing protein [Eggerthellaceae bacterium]